MKRLLTLLVTMAVALMAYPAFAAVNDTPHDYLGATGRGRCEVCHVPHAASSTTAKRLWRESRAIAADTGTWDTGVVGQLCGMCHGTSGAGPWATASNKYTVAPHNVGATAYATTSHGRTMATLGAGAIKDTHANASGRPYMNQTYIQCTSCHNVHDDTVRPFLRANGLGTPTGYAGPSISRVCGDCHDRYNQTVNNNTAGNGNSVATTINGARSMHPIDVAYADLAANNTNGGVTQFQEPPAAMKTDVAAMNGSAWVLGGKFQADDGTAVTTHPGTVKASGLHIGCQTCHAIHNPAATTDDSQSLYLLAVGNEPAMANDGSPLCEGCHGGGNRGIGSDQFVGAPRTGAGSETNSNLLDDHPIDITPDGTPALEYWGSTTRFERVPSGAFVAWPYAVGGGYKPVNVTNLGAVGNIGRIVCTSCHSAHNAVADTSLNRSGGDAGGWCFSCHLNADTVPGNHHSTKYQVAAPVGGNWADSQITCGSCHGNGAAVNLNAHMGFFILTNGAGLPIANDSSQLCNGCHGGGTTDPVEGYGLTTGPGGGVPNAHLSTPGGGGYQTHYIGSFTNGQDSINVKTGYWRATVMSGRDESYSKYGNTGEGDNHNAWAYTSVPAGSTVVCESCHSVLYNAGAGGLTGGWRVNLLLQNYEDNLGQSTDGTAGAFARNAGENWTETGVGSGFCVACHNQPAANAAGTGANDGFAAHSLVNDPAVVPANMHPMTDWDITRALDAGFSGAAAKLSTAGRYSYATPLGTTSYDGANQMSCDGCHRPHLAEPSGTWDVSYRGVVSVILEPSAGQTSSDYGPFCQQCHDM